MATMSSLFFSLFLTAVCRFEGAGSSVLVFSVHSHPSSRLECSGTERSRNFTGLIYNSFLFSLKPRGAHVSFGDCFAIYSLMNKDANKSRLGQYDAKYFLTGLNISEPFRFAPLHRYVFNDLQKIFLTLYHPRSLDDETSRTRTVSQPRPFYLAGASSSLQSESMSPVKYLAFKDDLLAYGVKGRKATNSSSVHFALGQESQSKGGIGGQGTLGTACVALRSRDEDRLNSLDLCGTFYQGKVPRLSANEDKRNLIISIASKELGTREATGNNDGPRVEEYLRYTNLGKGYDWCAAFVSWCYGQAGLPAPRNPWSPALFPKARVYWEMGKSVKEHTEKIERADIFGIYGAKVKRINHVGLVKQVCGDYLVSIEGNSNNRVESRRRHFRTIYALADWVEE